MSFAAKALGLMVALSSELALSAVCGTAGSDIQVAGLGIDFTAEGAPVECQFTKTGGSLSGEFKVKIKDLKSGMELRDEHLREALNSKENPEMKFTLSGWQVKSGAVAGSFTLNGKTQKISDWKAEVSGSKVVVKGTLDYTQYGLEQAKYKKAGATLATVPKVVGVTVEINI